MYGGMGKAFGKGGAGRRRKGWTARGVGRLRTGLGMKLGCILKHVRRDNRRKDASGYGHSRPVVDDWSMIGSCAPGGALLGAIRRMRAIGGSSAFAATENGIWWRHGRRQDLPDR